MRLLRCCPTPGGWRIVAPRWIFEHPSLEGAQAKAREVFPEAVFVVIFHAPRPKRKKRRKRFPSEVA